LILKATIDLKFPGNSTCGRIVMVASAAMQPSRTTSTIQTGGSIADQPWTFVKGSGMTGRGIHQPIFNLCIRHMSLLSMKHQHKLQNILFNLQLSINNRIFLKSLELVKAAAAVRICTNNFNETSMQIMI
jgi:hypothetical protein